jgi:predicted GNAT family acetyltransferase
MAREIVTSENREEYNEKKLSEPKEKKLGSDEKNPIMETKLGKSTAIYQINHNKKYIDINSVRTPKAHRGQGHGSEIMKHIHEKADELGYDTKLLASPLDKETKLNNLVDFYKKHGYEITGEKGNQANEPIMLRKHQKNK